MRDSNNLDQIINKLEVLEKGNRKTLIALELFKDCIDKNSKREEELEKKVLDLESKNKKIIGKLIGILDYFDSIYKFAGENGDLALLGNLEDTLKLIKNDLRDIGLEEVPALGELFNNKLHECIQIREEDGRLQYEILEVVKKGYTYNGEIIRPAGVIARK
ncbi:MAG: nucleotide exchange factor GrpE [Bacillota bacterium]|nr:nucleotide exchange factor GrpE [Bacillota bacterium]